LCNNFAPLQPVGLDSKDEDSTGREWAKRDYGEETCRVWGGDPNCEHEWTDEIVVRTRGVAGVGNTGNHSKVIPGQGTHQSHGMFCKKCGAWYGQLGLEPTPELYVEHLIEIFREVKRVLKPYGNVFIVIDDTYSGGGHGGVRKDGRLKDAKYGVGRDFCPVVDWSKVSVPRKSHLLIPELFAIRMVYEEGWILRNKIVWAKKIYLYKDRTTIGNAMPHSVKDRLNHTWEYVFHFVKKSRYWYDLDAVRVPHKFLDVEMKHRNFFDIVYYNEKAPDQVSKSRSGRSRAEDYHPLGANPGDVIQINTEPLKDSHYAPFPTKLVELLIKVGCPEQVCKKCGKPRERIVEIGEFVRTGGKRIKDTPSISEWQKEHGTGYHIRYTVGWTDCGCGAGFEPGIILDPFLGSGTTALVALQMGRRFIGIELNREFCKIALRRLGLFAIQHD